MNIRCPRCVGIVDTGEDHDCPEVARELLEERVGDDEDMAKHSAIAERLIESALSSDSCWCFGPKGTAAVWWKRVCQCEWCALNEVAADEKLCCECHD